MAHQQDWRSPQATAPSAKTVPRVSLSSSLTPAPESLLVCSACAAALCLTCMSTAGRLAKASHVTTHCLACALAESQHHSCLPCHFCGCMLKCLLVLQMIRPSKIPSSIRSQTLLTPYLSHMVSHNQAATVSPCPLAST